MKQPRRLLEKTIATASFCVAVVLTFVSLLMSKNNEIASNVIFVIAQFLTLTATLLGIDYKFSASNGISSIKTGSATSAADAPSL